MAQAAERNEEVARAFFETLSDGDLERIAACFHEDATWTVAASGIPGAGTHAGRDTIVYEFLAPVRDMFEPGNPRVTLTNVVADERWVAVEAVGEGRFRDGRDYRNQYAFFLELDEGKIRNLREYMDSHYVGTLVAG